MFQWQKNNLHQWLDGSNRQKDGIYYLPYPLNYAHTVALRRISLVTIYVFINSHQLCTNFLLGSFAWLQNNHVNVHCKIWPRLHFSLIILPRSMLKKSSVIWNPKSSTGYDNISSKWLKYIGDIVSVPLSIIVNQSLCTGIFPDKFKIAKVIPLYKKQDEKIFWNYRPISLLSYVSKVFERIVFDQLYDYFTTNGLLFNSQYGFRKQHSTELAAFELTHKIRREIDQKKTPFSVYLDLS